MNRVFDFVSKRARAYRLTFSDGLSAENAPRIVLADLANFCRAAESCVVPGDRDRTLLLEGRREVWLRIQQHLKMSNEQLFSLFNGGK
jgi:hypothetical protein